MKNINKILLLLITVMGGWFYFDEQPEPLALHSLPVPDTANATVADTIDWDRPRFSERMDDREQLVKKIENQGISDSNVLEAMRQVPRHLFVPRQYQQHAYLNRPLPIGHDQTISQPYIVAYMKIGRAHV